MLVAGMWQQLRCGRARTDPGEGPIKVTLITKATGGFWDAMIAGAQEVRHGQPDQIELTTLACKTNDDTPCQIAQIQDSVTKGAKAIVVSPMGPGSCPLCRRPQQAGVKIVFVDNTLPAFTADCGVRRPTTSRAARPRATTSRRQLKSGDTIGLMEAVKGVPRSTPASRASRRRSRAPGVKVVIGRPADHLRPEDRRRR